MIVVDASVAVNALLDKADSRALLVREELHAPQLIDLEVLSFVRRSARSGAVRPDQALSALDAWRSVPLERHAQLDLLPRIWALRDALTPYDASYIALAEWLGCALVTGDARMACAAGVTCATTLLA